MNKLLLFSFVIIATLSWAESQRTCGHKYWSEINGLDSTALRTYCDSTVHFMKMKYTVTNSLKAPFFSETAELDMYCQARYRSRVPLIKYMERSVLEFPDNFTGFTTTFSSPWGYYINSINDREAVYAEDQSYWSILNQDGYLQKGVSSYIPQPGDEIVFNLTQYTGTHV